MARPRLFLHDSIGRGDRRANRSDDIVAVKQRLSRLGFYEPPPEGIGDDIDAGFEIAIRAFQRDNGLQEDGRLEPGGETERNLAAIDDDEIERAVSDPKDIQLKGRVGARGPNDRNDVVAVKQALSDIGLYPHDRTAPPPPFVDTKMVEAIREFQRDNDLTEDGFLDPDGETVEALRRGRPGTRPGETEVAAAQLLPAAARAAQAVGKWFRGNRVPMPPPLHGAKPESNDIPREDPDEDRAGSRFEALPPRGPQIEAFPAEPPDKLDNIETLPAEKPRGPEIFISPEETRKLPDRTESPADPMNLPNKVIYESLEDDEFWRQFHILKRYGNEDTKQVNTELANYVVKVGIEMGRCLEVINGGYDGDGKYRPEFTLSPKGALQVTGSPNKNRSFLDVAVEDCDTKEVFLFNTIDIYRRTGNPKPREAFQEVKVFNNKKNTHHFMTVPKPRKGTNLKEYVESFDGQIRDMLKKTAK